MAIEVCCESCDWSTDLELTSDTNPSRCPKCGEDIVLTSNGYKSNVPLYVDGEINSLLFED
jgi:predicted RNA-binding Zn-ribbon protein involved in translation (DUF1610 family)